MVVAVVQAQRQLWLCGKHKYKTQAGAAEGAGKSREDGNSVLPFILCPQALSAKACVYVSVASLLACNLAAALLILPPDNGLVIAASINVTYSCASARDLHTVPF